MESLNTKQHAKLASTGASMRSRFNQLTQKQVDVRAAEAAHEDPDDEGKLAELEKMIEDYESYEVKAAETRQK